MELRLTGTNFGIWLVHHSPENKEQHIKIEQWKPFFLNAQDILSYLCGFETALLLKELWLIIVFIMKGVCFKIPELRNRMELYQATNHHTFKQTFLVGMSLLCGNCYKTNNPWEESLTNFIIKEEREIMLQFNLDGWRP